jgi:gas vesicle protein
MKTRKHAMEKTKTAAKPVLSGFLVGSVIGAATALLFAPRSGEELRTGIRDKAVELRDQATDTVKDTVSQVKSKATDARDNLMDKVDGLKQRGKQSAARQLDRVSEAAQTEKEKVQEY